MRRSVSAGSLLTLVFSFLANVAGAQSIQLSVDLSDASRNIYHSQLTIPVKPGPLTLVYPEWIPGNHRPAGPIANVTGIKMEANKQTLAWQRDPIDMYAFHVDVPAGASELKVSLDTITNDGSAGASGPAATTNVLDLNWNQVVLYPQGASSDAVQVEAAVTPPQGWKFATALPVFAVTKSGTNEFTRFKPVSLTTLIDSPLIAGDHYRRIELTKPGESPMHVIDMVSESDSSLAMTAADEAAYRKLVAETGALFGARHYLEYHFLLTLSDEAGHHGVEHHQSSDNSVKERTLLEPDLRLTEAGLLPHEFTHSWNGKYRRPAGLATRNYQDPMVGDLLWVYEGLTEYLGDVLTARSGLWTPEQYREALAETAAMLDHRTGRTWRPLEDTARSVQILRLQGPEWQSWRRGLDYYPEGELIWLEVDTTIRQQSHGEKSLNDFCRLFYGGESGPPKVVPYTFDDVVRTLNQVTPYDWAGLLKTRVNSMDASRAAWRHRTWRLAAGVQRSAQFVYPHGRKIAQVGGRFLLSGLRGPGRRRALGRDLWLAGLRGRDWSGDEAGRDQRSSLVERCVAGCAAHFQRQPAADRFAGGERQVLQDLLHCVPRWNQESSFGANPRAGCARRDFNAADEVSRVVRFSGVPKVG